MPFRHMGRSRSGLDCAGLVACCLRDIGHTVTDSPHYRSRAEYLTLRDGLEANLLQVSDAQDGDVLTFAMHGAHCGIVDGSGFWHVLRDRCVMWTPLRGVWSSSHADTFAVG